MKRVFFATISNRKRDEGFAFLYCLVRNFNIVLYLHTSFSFNVAFTLGQEENL